MKYFLGAILLSFSLNTFGALKVVTTTTDLKFLTEEVGGSLVEVESIAKGTQDLHFIEAKPSFMTKMNRADLIISIGLELEIGWLPSLVQGARNPKISTGQKGNLEVGPLVTPLEVPSGKVSRAEGDVHPFGNPHVTLDPIRCGQIALEIAKRLGDLDSGNSITYLANAKKFQERMESETKKWRARVEKSGVRSIVSYHRTLTYFFERFQISNPEILEPKPGIPPTSGHIIDVIQKIKRNNIPLVLVENYFDSTVTNKMKVDAPNLRVETVPVSVSGTPEIRSLDDLFENLVKAIEGKQ